MDSTSSLSPAAPTVVLLVDDDPFTRARVKQALRESDTRQYWVFHEADWGREALGLIEGRPYDCVFLSCDLKDMDPLGFLQRLYNSDIGICASPIVLIAGQGDDALMLDAFRLGAQDYLLKESLSAVSIHIAMTKARDMHDLRRSWHRAERELSHIRKMEAIGKMTSGVAHDFNNLLSVVMGNIGQLRRRLDDPQFLPEEIAPKIAAIETVSQRGADLIKRLKMFSRQTPLAEEVTDPNEMILETVALLRNVIGSNVVIETALDKELWPVLLDRSEFQNVLINFAVNARDAMPSGGTLRITSQNMPVDISYAAQHRGMRPGLYSVLTIHDTGRGMSTEVMARVFEPFFTTKAPGVGTGLGMSMAYGFIKESGGYVSVESKEGQGTTFRLYLPKAADNDVALLQEAQSRARA